MSAPPRQRLPPGHACFVRYAYPPNALGYCGPADSAALLRSDDPVEITRYAKDFDGTWPYLQALADAAGVSDALDERVVRSYWVGGGLVTRTVPETLLDALRTAFAGQRAGLLADLTGADGVLAHHSFHVLVVYPWIRFLDRAAGTALHVLQNCRIRWGIVESVDDQHLTMSTSPLTFDGRALGLARPAAERVRWRTDDVSLIAQPRPGDLVAAHWDWVCDTLNDEDTAALSAATRTTIDVVNGHRTGRHPAMNCQDTPKSGFFAPVRETPSEGSPQCHSGAEKEI